MGKAGGEGMTLGRKGQIITSISHGDVIISHRAMIVGSVVKNKDGFTQTMHIRELNKYEQRRRRLRALRDKKLLRRHVERKLREYACGTIHQPTALGTL